MKIRTRYMLNFVLLVAGILLAFTVIIIIFYYSYRNRDFAIRLKYKAINTATMQIKIKAIDNSLLRIIDDNSVSSLNDITVIILNMNRKIIYSSRDSAKISGLFATFEKLDWTKEDKILVNHKLFICFQQHYQGTDYYVLACGMDRLGQDELIKLLVIMSIAFLISIVLIFLAGFYNAKQSVKPIKSIIHQVSEINASKLGTRLSIKSDDEIAELSANFNSMLDRLEMAFENERMFVSNASHELRTPVTSVIGQLEVSLLKYRSGEEYRAIIISILDDMKKMKVMINGFLDLAESGLKNDEQLVTVIRIDELLFSIKDELLLHNDKYLIVIVFENMPEDENEIMIKGNERLIKMMLMNLVDNACKFSQNHTATLTIAYDSSEVITRVIDQGIGIPSGNLAHIFEPLFKGDNAGPNAGHGIGLSIVKRIADLHHAKIEIESTEHKGTTVSVFFPVSRSKMPGNE